MRKLLIIISIIALPLVDIQSTARAGDGGAIAAGIIGGLALGGIAAAAVASRPRYAPNPAYGYGYGYRQVYYAPRNCWTQRRRARDDFGNVYFRRVRVCG